MAMIQGSMIFCCCLREFLSRHEMAVDCYFSTNRQGAIIDILFGTVSSIVTQYVFYGHWYWTEVIQKNGMFG
jgi:hypothetical protein